MGTNARAEGFCSCKQAPRSECHRFLLPQDNLLAACVPGAGSTQYVFTQTSPPLNLEPLLVQAAEQNPALGCAFNLLDTEFEFQGLLSEWLNP